LAENRGVLKDLSEHVFKALNTRGPGKREVKGELAEEEVGTFRGRFPIPKVSYTMEHLSDMLQYIENA
jgi:hypothetical protein